VHIAKSSANIKCQGKKFLSERRYYGVMSVVLQQCVFLQVCGCTECVNVAGVIQRKITGSVY